MQWLSRFPLVAIAVLLTGRAESSDEGARADRIRVAYLYNFAHYVQWPGMADTQPIRFCFVGGVATFNAFTAPAAARTIDQHPAEARALRDGESPQGCQLLYVEASTHPPTAPAKQLSAPALLTVSEQPDFLRQGGVIELFTDNNHLRFRVSLSNAHRASLVMSSNLLQLAATVEQAPP